jgi:uncharacterized protein (TIGR01777 family)
LKIVIPGGSGQVGTILARAFVAQGHEVVVLTRKPAPAPWRTVEWDAKTLDAWKSEVDGADVVINLAGRSVNCRYTPAHRREITESRVFSTQVVGQAIARAAHPPAVWLQAGTATIYAHRYDAPNDEATGILADEKTDAPETWQFSLGVGRAWERALNEAVTPRTRKVILRTSLVMSPDSGGVFDVLLGLARRGLGGRAGDGRQYVSWVHDEDFTSAILFLIDKEAISGPVILAAPQPLPNADFMRAIREAARIPFGLPAAQWMLEIGAFFMRTETELILKSRRVIPGRLLENGFTFKFSAWPEAARDLYRRWQSARRSPALPTA